MQKMKNIQKCPMSLRGGHRSQYKPPRKPIKSESNKTFHYVLVLVFQVSSFIEISVLIFANQWETPINLHSFSSFKYPIIHAVVIVLYHLRNSLNL